MKRNDVITAQVHHTAATLLKKLASNGDLKMDPKDRAMASITAQVLERRSSRAHTSKKSSQPV